MHVKIGLGAAIATTFALALIAPTADATQASTTNAAPTIAQAYSCTTPIGDIDLSGTVTGKATIKGKKISLKKVQYAVTNSVGLDLTIDSIKVYVPDPGSAAPYKANSVKIAKKPKGWKAGHDATGIFASFAGSEVVANGDNVTVAALSAGYTAKGAKGTVVDFVPGDVTFHVSSPIAGDVSCTPDSPGTFASVTE